MTPEELDEKQRRWNAGGEPIEASELIAALREAWAELEKLRAPFAVAEKFGFRPDVLAAKIISLEAKLAQAEKVVEAARAAIKVYWEEDCPEDPSDEELMALENLDDAITAYDKEKV